MRKGSITNIRVSPIDIINLYLISKEILSMSYIFLFITNYQLQFMNLQYLLFFLQVYQIL